MVDCYVTESHPYYQVWVDGRIVDEFTMGMFTKGRVAPLTWSQQWDIAAGYRDWYEAEQTR